MDSQAKKKDLHTNHLTDGQTDRERERERERVRGNKRSG